MQYTLPQALAYAELARQRRTRELVTMAKVMRVSFVGQAEHFEAAIGELENGE